MSNVNVMVNVNQDAHMQEIIHACSLSLTSFISILKVDNDSSVAF